MNISTSRPITRGMQLALPLLGALLAVSALLFFMGQQTLVRVQAAPVPPPEGYPKLSLSTKVVTPTLTGTGGAELEYIIEIVNTGAYTAEGVTLTDTVPNHTTFTGKMGSSAPPAPVFANGILTWEGDVGFDTSVQITFSVDVISDYAGIISNTAQITHPQIPEPVLVAVESAITDDPILEIEKTSSPEKPGANKPLHYEIAITNRGQSAANLPIIVVDMLPLDTALLDVGPDGASSPAGDVITWTRAVTLAFQESTVFTFSVTVDNVPSGTIINNASYYVSSAQTGVSAGEAYTVTVIDPILFIAKETDPHPPGSNREMMYALTILNKGSLATDLTIIDVMPDGVTYIGGGSYADGVVEWAYPSLDTNGTAQFTYTVYIGDVADVDVINATYEVCSAEGICQVGEALTSSVEGPTFEVAAKLDPIAKKPGGGGGPVTPTLTVENLGPGNALDATATLYFERISVQLSDLVAVPPVGLFSDGPECGDKCVAYYWTGDISYGDTMIFTTEEGHSTIGGEEGTLYTATVVVSDSLGAYTTEPVTATATGKITHYANLIPTKSAPRVIGAGQIMTYTIQVFNSGLSTDDPPFPVLTETVPASLTVMSVSDSGVEQDVGGRTIISWMLPAMSPGDRVNRTFSALVDENLISGTEIINADYRATWYDIGMTETLYLSNTGTPITTVVKEVGLIDSYKIVTPALTSPGSGNVLTYVVHVVNTSLIDLEGISVHDILPWESSTYRRDAIASSGQIISDIVSIDWFGDVSASSSEQITFTVLVDADFEGAITNTAIINHSSLNGDVVVKAVAYITNDPVLQITKSASPNPVRIDNELLYTIKVVNLGQQATLLEVWDLIPANTTYVVGSASTGGTLVDGEVRWQLPVLLPGTKQTLTFRVQVLEGAQVINSDYGITCAEGVRAVGETVITVVTREGFQVYLPLISR